MSIPPVVKNKLGRLSKVPAYELREVLHYKQAILEDEQQLENVEEMDQLLADQHNMQCPNWERTQLADPVIRRMKELIEEFGDVAPNDVQLTSELAEVKHLCSHWNLLEIINGVVTCAMKDLTGCRINLLVDTNIWHM